VYSAGELSGYGGAISIIGLNIPKYAETYTEFMDQMGAIENALLNSINKIADKTHSL
jgi:hypothetical protein